MRVGVLAVRETLGDGLQEITESEIREALWHYYYDVEKTVNYLLQSKIPKHQANKKKAKGRVKISYLSSEPACRVLLQPLTIMATVENSNSNGASYIASDDDFHKVSFN